MTSSHCKKVSITFQEWTVIKYTLLNITHDNCPLFLCCNVSFTHITTRTATFSDAYKITAHSRKIMSPCWVAPCNVYRFRKCSPGLKIPLAAARQERVCRWGGGGYFSKVSRFRSGQESQILNKTVSPPLAPRLQHQQNVRPLWRLGSVHTCTST